MRAAGEQPDKVPPPPVYSALPPSLPFVDDARAQLLVYHSLLCRFAPCAALLALEPRLPAHVRGWSLLQLSYSPPFASRVTGAVLQPLSGHAEISLSPPHTSPPVIQLVSFTLRKSNEPNEQQRQMSSKDG